MAFVERDEDGLDGGLGLLDMFWERAGNWLRGDGFWTDSALDRMAEMDEESSAYEELDEEGMEGVEFGLDDPEELGDDEDDDDC